MKSVDEWYDVIGIITNKKDYRIKYGMMEIIEKSDTENKEAFVIASKKRLREYTHFDKTRFVYDKKYEINARLVKDDGIDGFVELVQLPKECETYDDAKEFFENNLYLESPYSAYDCTGCMFTSWYYIFKRNERYFAYHRVSRDI